MFPLLSRFLAETPPLPIVQKQINGRKKNVSTYIQESLKDVSSKEARLLRLIYNPDLRKGIGPWGFKGERAICWKVRRGNV